ncbi:MAG: hypothetical protein V1746_06140 [bacterium]
MKSKKTDFDYAFSLNKYKGQVPPYYSVAFRINWGCSDKTLLSDFKNWLKENRKKCPQERQGRNWRDILKNIGAMRLLHHYSLEEATKLTVEALGKPLYGKRPSWERARKNALEFFQYEFLVDSYVENPLPISSPKKDKN